MTNAMNIDPASILRDANHATPGWWIALFVLIIVIGGGWLLVYMLKRHETMVTDLKTNHGDTIKLLVTVVERNTEAHSAASNELRQLSGTVSRLETAFNTRMSVRQNQQAGGPTHG